MPSKIYPLRIKPGIKRDGTILSNNHYIDGQWNRFQRGFAKKIGGYTEIGPTNSIGVLPPNLSRLRNIQRGCIVIPNGENFDIYSGDSDGLNKISIDQFGNPISFFSNARTPVGFLPSQSYLWVFDSMFSTTDDSSTLLALAVPNLNSIDNSISTDIYYGITDSNAPLVPTGVKTAGAFVVLHPYLFVFGNNGELNWSEANNPTSFPHEPARVASRKIVAGFAARGGNSSPAGLLWSLDSLIRVTFVGGDAEFAFDTITSDSSILSSQSVVEYDGTYFWPAIDRFLIYNGVVKEVPNDMSLNFFYDNVNFSQRQKIWGTKVPRFGEIWWFFPKGDSIECNHAIIYNVRENTWYDTDINRSCGYFSQTFHDPIWLDNVLNNYGGAGGPYYPMWRHENGVDKVENRPDDQNIYSPIDSFFETSDIAWCALGPNQQYNFTDRWVSLDRVEPDFLQSGSMSLTVTGNEYAQSAPEVAVTEVFGPATPKIDLKEQRRQMRLKFRSNVIGGNYEMGQVLMSMTVGDGRQ